MTSSVVFKKHSSNQHSGQYEGSSFAIRDLQTTIQPRNHLVNRDLCHCKHCFHEKIEDKALEDGNLFEAKSKSSTLWLKKLLDNLCLSGANTLKINLPDLLFVMGESFETFQTSRKNGRLVKLSGTTPLKSLYATMIRYRKEYKYMLELNFNEKMLESIDPDFMHMNYFDKFVPTHFHEGMADIGTLKQNRSQFKRYILHTSQKYEIQQIEEHKMNNNEAFCIIKYDDGNCQLYNQLQFEIYMMGSMYKIQESVVYVQSYIKYKLETEAVYYSNYVLSPQSMLEEIDKRAEIEVMTLLGGVSKYEKTYTDPHTSDEIMHEMMLQTPQKYVDLMTYKLVHYLNMTSRIYIDHIKIKWIINDLGNIYLQEIMEFEMSEVPRRLIRYRLPPKDEAIDLVTNTNNFGDLYVEMKRKRNVNTMRIKKVIVGKPMEDIHQMMNIRNVEEEEEEPAIDDIQAYYQERIKEKKRVGSSYAQKRYAKNMGSQRRRKVTSGDQNSARDMMEGKGNNMRSITIDTTSQKESSMERVKLNFNRYFTINQSLESKSGRKLALGSKTERTINLHAPTVQKKQSFSHRYGGSVGRTLQASEKGRSLVIN